MAEPLALYVHWPFCVSKCPYCDFNSHVRESVDQAVWREALLADLRHEAALLPGRPVSSIFFGGGTPSLMPPETVAAVIGAAGDAWGLADDWEITLEANPNSVEVANFAALASAGVNRVSIGVQSFDPQILEFLGRAHSGDEARRAIAAAQKHFARVSFDLIYARPGQSLGQWDHARPGEESRHNLTYWRYGDYAGVGPGAHGRRLGEATERHKKPENFIAAVERNGHGLKVETDLPAHERATEALLMGLRLTEGIDLARVEARSGLRREAFVDEGAVARLAAQGLIVQDGDRLAVTDDGILLLDSILSEVVRTG